MGEECTWCVGLGTQFCEHVVFYKGHSRRKMGSQKSACACQASMAKLKPARRQNHHPRVLPKAFHCKVVSMCNSSR